MPKETDLVAAAVSLSTASDGFSIKVDTLISKIDAALEAVKNDELSPEGVAAMEVLKKSRDIVVAQGDKVDAEVLKLDAVLPTPAPAGSPT